MKKLTGMAISHPFLLGDIVQILDTTHYFEGIDIGIVAPCDHPFIPFHYQDINIFIYQLGDDNPTLVCARCETSLESIRLLHRDFSGKFQHLVDILKTNPNYFKETK